MVIVWILAPMALLMGIAFLVSFIWAAKRGQMDDLDTPPLRMLIDENKVEHKEEKH